MVRKGLLSCKYVGGGWLPTSIENESRTCRGRSVVLPAVEGRFASPRSPIPSFLGSEVVLVMGRILHGSLSACLLARLKTVQLPSCLLTTSFFR